MEEPAVMSEHKDNEPLGLVLMLGSLGLFTVTMVFNRII